MRWSIALKEIVNLSLLKKAFVSNYIDFFILPKAKSSKSFGCVLLEDTDMSGEIFQTFFTLGGLLHVYNPLFGNKV